MSLSLAARRAAAVLAALVIAGCAVAPSAPPSPGAPPGSPPGLPPRTLPPPAAPAAPTLADEQRRLSKLLAGTPVVVELTADGELRIEVPLEHSFDTGRAAVKPALGAVLDRLATGLRRQPGTELRIAAPSDPGGSSMLAADRAASTRDYLVGRGVPTLRFVSVARGERAAVEVVVSERFASAR